MELTAYSFVSIALGFAQTIGLSPFQKVVNGKATPIPKWKTILITLNCLNTSFFIVTEVVYLRIAFRSLETFFEAVEVIMTITFLNLSFIKMGTIVWRRPLLTWMIGDLSDMLPKTATEHRKYRTDFYLHEANQIMRLYSVVQMMMIWMYNASPLIIAAFEYVTQGVWHFELPYTTWYPVNPYASGWVWVNYMLQIACAYSCSAGILATDLLLCGLGMEICMQFDLLANRLRALKAKGGQWARQDFAELRTCVIRHNRLIKLTNAFNDIFGVCILINVMTNSSSMCVVGFMTMISKHPLEKITHFVSLISFMVQIYLISLLGEKFLKSSSSVADAAWHGDWINGSTEYRISILLVIYRAQKPQYLKAYKFMVATMEMFTSVMSTSWRFFALLQQVYEE